MTNNDELVRDWVEFLSWWELSEQHELRKSCAQGWGWKIWRAARSKQEN